MNESIKIPLVLVIVCIISALLLSLTYGVAKPKIDTEENKILNNKLKEVLNANSFVKLSEENPALFAKMNSVVEEVYIGKQSSLSTEAIGSVFLLSRPGYSGDIKFLVGITKGKVTAVNIFTQTETPGLGTRIEEEPFLSQFRDQPTNQDKYDTITGATVSSATVIYAMIDAIKTLNEDLTSVEKKELGITTE